MKSAKQIVAAAEKDAAYLTGETSGAMYFASMTGILTAHIKDLCDKLENYQAPSSTQEVCQYGDLVIHFDYQPEEKQTWDEPAYHAAADVCAVYCNGMDILEFIGDYTLNEIQQACLESVKQARQEEMYDRADEYYQSRKDDQLMGAV
jgi:hypothetical protein